MANKHLSYRQFKNIFGDLGVTYWTKYNWLSNGLPDGEYNGITKVTNIFINDNVFWNDQNKCIALSAVYNKLIGAGENHFVWSYGFSNYKIITRNNQTAMIETEPNFAVSATGNIYVQLQNCNSLEEAFAYLKKHPIILYYYDKDIWGGVILPTTGWNLTNEVFYRNDGLPESVILSTDIRDVEGKFERVNGGTTVQIRDNPKDLIIANGSIAGDITAQPRRITIKDNKYKSTQTGFRENDMPRAIVYKLVPDGWARVDIGTLDFTRKLCNNGVSYYFQAIISDLPNNTQTIGQPWKDVACDSNIDITTVTYNGENAFDAAFVKKAGCSANDGYVCFYFDYSKDMTVEQFKEWIKGKYFYYKLAVPQ